MLMCMSSAAMILQAVREEGDLAGGTSHVLKERLLGRWATKRHAVAASDGLTSAFRSSLALRVFAKTRHKPEAQARPVGFHVDRASGGDRHNRNPYRFVGAGSSEGTRSGGAHPMCQQPQANRAGLPQPARRLQSAAQGPGLGRRQYFLLLVPTVQLVVPRVSLSRTADPLQHAAPTEGGPA